MHDVNKKPVPPEVGEIALARARRLMADALQLIQHDPELQSAARELRLALDAVDALHLDSLSP